MNDLSPTDRRALLGQFFTPPAIAEFMASLFPGPFPPAVRLLDPGAGQGALATAFAARWQAERPEGGTLAVDAYELDPLVLDLLREVLSALGEAPGVTADLLPGDFVALASAMLREERGPRYSHAILNPPYRKIGVGSPERAALRSVGLETVNLYAGFVALAVALLARGGQAVAIIPRSFCNGPYYERFRGFVLGRAALRRVHLFHARNKAFASDGVLQENVILLLERGAAQGDVIVSTSSDDTFTDLEERVHPFDRIVFPDDPKQFIHLPTDHDDDLLEAMSFACSLADLGVTVSTGPVVDFRMKDDLRADPGEGTAPLLYPGHFAGDGLLWPRPGFKKPNAIRDTAATRKWLYPGGFYAVAKRFSSKEEARRVVAHVVDPAALAPGPIGFENHLNVFHQKRGPLPEELARGLATFLNAGVVDAYVRRFNGHTQVNATDLRSMRYPSRRDLLALGAWAKGQSPTPEAIDARLAELA